MSKPTPPPAVPKPAALFILGAALLSQAQSPFTNPQRTCAVLEPEGIRTQGWRADPSGMSGYYCQNDIPVGARHELTGLDNRIMFAAEGAQSGRIDRVLMEARYYRILPKQPVKGKLVKVVNRLYAGMGQSVPAAILKAIETETPYKGAGPLGSVEVTRECGPPLPLNNRMCWVSVVMRPAK